MKEQGAHVPAVLTSNRIPFFLSRTIATFVRRTCAERKSAAISYALRSQICNNNKLKSTQGRTTATLMKQGMGHSRSTTGTLSSFDKGGGEGRHRHAVTKLRGLLGKRTPPSGRLGDCPEYPTYEHILLSFRSLTSSPLTLPNPRNSFIGVDCQSAMAVQFLNVRSFDGATLVSETGVYEMGNFLGSGAAGTVYEATRRDSQQVMGPAHPELLLAATPLLACSAQSVAVKILNPIGYKLAPPQLIQRCQVLHTVRSKPKRPRYPKANIRPPPVYVGPPSVGCRCRWACALYGGARVLAV